MRYINLHFTLLYFTLYVHFRGFCPLTEFCPVQNSLYVQVLRSSVLSAQRYCTAPSSESQPNFASWYKEWNYGTFANGATYIPLGGRITLGIGPHSSLLCISFHFLSHAFLSLLFTVILSDVFLSFSSFPFRKLFPSRSLMLRLGLWGAFCSVSSQDILEYILKCG